jgi:chondroitin B lyase
MNIKAIIIWMVFFTGMLFPAVAKPSGKELEASSVKEVYKLLPNLKPGDRLLLADGIYKDIRLIVNVSGSPEKPISIASKNPGEVFFTGDVKIELRGEYLILKDIYFKDGSRNPSQWYSHGPGLVAIYGSYNRVTGCVFNAFDQANSAYITTSVTEDGKVPQYCRIDRCVFTDKITFDQVINLNNRPRADKESKVLGTPMYHRVDHCFFANPPKPGNAGGGIRIGYYRNDIGRCLIDSNVFMRQDSEAEIITSKSQENIFYNNTFLNCRGTLNFRHGDKQIAINNFFIGNDKKYGYGGMFVWGSKHIIANNYFSLQQTIAARGNAALYLNQGPEASEHALAFDILVINNVFDNNNGYAVNFDPLANRRRTFAEEHQLTFKYPYDINLQGNVFFQKNYAYNFFKVDSAKASWENNYAYGASLGVNPDKGIRQQPFKILKDHDFSLEGVAYAPVKVKDIKDIEGVALAINTLINKGFTGKPLTWDEVRPQWLTHIPGDYALTAKLSPENQQKFNEVIKTNK